MMIRSLVLLCEDFFWLPAVGWTFYLLFSKFVAYPIALKKNLLRGEHWVYVPLWWSEFPKRSRLIYATLFFLSFFSVITSVWLVCFAIENLGGDFRVGLLSAIVFIAFSFLGFQKFSKGVYEMQQSAHFLFYRRLVYCAQMAGLRPNREDILSECSWEFRRTLREVELKGRLLRYLRAASRTKKIPKDLYAEAAL